MKPITWDNPNKMHFESPHLAFNKQTQIITRGNAWATTQHSSYIRAYNDLVMPAGDPCAPGHLQNFDLKAFSEYGVPRDVLNMVRTLLGRDGTGILYLFKHYNGKQRINDGLVLTDVHYRHIRTWFLNESGKAYEAVVEARKYITHEYDDDHPYDE